MTWHVYEFQKTGSSLAGMLSLSEFETRLVADAGVDSSDLIKAELDDAMEAAGVAGWHGKLQGEPCIFVLPNDDNFQFGFVWTGERTTVFAPVALPWMTPQHVAPC